MKHIKISEFYELCKRSYHDARFIDSDPFAESHQAAMMRRGENYGRRRLGGVSDLRLRDSQALD